MKEIKKSLEEAAVKAARELEEYSTKTAGQEDEPTPWKTIGWLFVLLVLAAIGYAMTAGGN